MALESRTDIHEIFCTDILVEYLNRYFAGNEDNSRKIWVVYTFLVWYDAYFND